VLGLVLVLLRSARSRFYSFISSKSPKIILHCQIFIYQMEFINSISSLLGKWLRPSNKPLAFESSALGRLPPELILHIAEFLPLESASSLSICCRPIYFILGTQYLNTLSKSYRYRDEFLLLLVRDLPDHTVCDYCGKLHPIDQVLRQLYAHKWYDPQLDPLDYVRTDPYFSYLHSWEQVDRIITPFMFHQNYSFSDLYTTIRPYNQGIDHSKLLHLLSYKTCTSRRFGLVKQYKWDARVVASSLLTREQTIWLLAPAQPIRIPMYWDIDICRHIKSSWTDDILLHKGKQAKSWCFELKEPIDHHNLGGIKQCNGCRTEYRIDLKQFGEQGTAIFVTKWRDWGEYPTYQGVTTLPQIGQPVAFERGSICTAFEQKEYCRFEFDSISTIEDWETLFKTGPKTSLDVIRELNSF
jgi:hypothetical protein